jgi:hypothetical protein
MKIIKDFGLREAFISLLIAGLSIGIVKHFSRQAGVWRTIRLEVVGSNWSLNQIEPSKPPFWLGEKIKQGDKELGVGGEEIAQVLRVENYERGDERTDVYLTVKVKTELNQKSGKYIFKGKAIEVGVPIELRLDRVFINGQILSDHVFEEVKSKEVIVKGRWRNQEPWRINNIYVGDQMLDMGSNKAIAEILSVWTEKPSLHATINITYDRQLEINSSSRWIDGVLKAKLKVEEHDSKWYFAGHYQLKVGQHIELILPSIDVLYMEIEEIEELN